MCLVSLAEQVLAATETLYHHIDDDNIDRALHCNDERQHLLSSLLNKIQAIPNFNDQTVLDILLKIKSLDEQALNLAITNKNDTYQQLLGLKNNKKALRSYQQI